MEIHHIQFKDYYTRAYSLGDVRNGVPLIILHGGPGGSVEKYEPLEKLADYGIPLIFYDQLGCGYSKVPKNHKITWNFQLFLDELENLISYFNLKKFYVLGHSWGGMLALEWVCNFAHPGLQKLILFSTLPSTKMWNDEHVKMIDDFPNKEKEAILNEFAGKDFDVKANKKGIKRFYDEHVGKKHEGAYKYKRNRFPKLNREIYELMWGKTELFGTGTLKDWSCEDKLNKVDVPTLIISGALDESTPAMNKFMNENIKDSKWVLLEKSHHSGYREEPRKVINTIKLFLK